MQSRSRIELYQSFLDFINTEIQHERSKVNRRMFNVFLWCFILPAIAAATFVILVATGIFPRSSRANLDWIILVFPVAYSLYLLSSEVLMHVPANLRRGGIATVLRQSQEDTVWRDRICDGLKRSVATGHAEWKWIASNFRIDLDRMAYRTRYLTALAGAIFYLLMNGLDLLSDDPAAMDPGVTWMKSPVGWVEIQQNNFPQFVGLGLFLVLFFLSGSQTYQILKRFLCCAELITEDKKTEA